MASQKNLPSQGAAKTAELEAAAKQLERRQALFKETKEELVKKQISNSENFDRSVLTLSSSALGLSLAFTKDIAPFATAHARWALLASWVLFAAAIISTMASFLVSQQAIKNMIAAAQRYYLDHDEKSLKAPNRAADLTERLNYISGIAFVLGMVLTMWFVIINLPPKIMPLQTPTPTSVSAPIPPPTTQSPVGGATAGQPIGQLQPVPPPPPKK